jgi:hypothetical protein
MPSFLPKSLSPFLFSKQHGLQLKGNYLATKSKLEKVKEKELFKEAVTTTTST